jgi:hypothetical protein
MSAVIFWPSRLKRSCHKYGCHDTSNNIEFNKSNEGNMSKKELVKRSLISIAPATIIMVDYKIAFSAYPAVAFCISWALIMWATYKLESKDSVMARYYRILSMAFLVMPVAAMMGAGRAASSAAGVDVSEAEKTGAAIGGGIVVMMAMIVSLPMAVIFHFAAKSRIKNIKAEAEKKEFIEFQKELDKHRI